MLVSLTRIFVLKNHTSGHTTGRLVTHAWFLMKVNVLSLVLFYMYTIVAVFSSVKFYSWLCCDGNHMTTHLFIPSVSYPLINFPQHFLEPQSPNSGGSFLPTIITYIKVRWVDRDSDLLFFTFVIHICYLIELLQPIKLQCTSPLNFHHISPMFSPVKKTFNKIFL